MPQTNPVMQNGFLQQNFVRLDKDFQVMHKATRAQGILIQSMTLMDQQVQQRVRMSKKLGSINDEDFKEDSMSLKVPMLGKKKSADAYGKYPQDLIG